jgi:hypothetical protein
MLQNLFNPTDINYSVILCFTVQILYPTVGTYWKLNPSKFRILSWCFCCAMEDSYFWNYYTKFQTPPSVPETAVNQLHRTGTETMLWQYEDDIYHTLSMTKLQGICLYQLLQHLQACTPPVVRWLNGLHCHKGMLNLTNIWYFSMSHSDGLQVRLSWGIAGVIPMH